MLQRYYKIGFNRAARIMDQLADAGVVGPEVGTKPVSYTHLDVYKRQVTFRTAAAEESIRVMHEAYPDMVLAAGTVLTTEQVDRACLLYTSCDFVGSICGIYNLL